MLHIPTLTGLFEPQPYVPPKDATANNITTIGALQDPSGTLERMQAEQVAKMSANIKMEGIDAKYKGLALDAINDFQNKSLGLYKGNKGFNRLRLDGKQLLQEQSNYNELLTNVNALKQLTADNQQTLETVDRAFIGQAMNKEDYDLFAKKVADAEAKTKTIGDVPNYRAIYNNFLHERPQRGVTDKTIQGYTAEIALRDKALANINQGMDQQKAWDPEVAKRNVAALPADIIAHLGGTDAVVQNAKDSWIKQRASGTNIFMPSTIKNWTAPYTIPTQTKKVVFKQDKIKGFVATEQIKDVNGNVVAEIGDVVKPTTLENGAVSINVIKNGKYQVFDVGDGTKEFMPSPGSVAEPKAGKIAYEGQIKEQIQNMAGRPDGSGNIDPSGYEKVGATGSAARSKTTPVKVGGVTISVDLSIPYTIEQIESMFPAVKGYSQSDIKKIFIGRGFKIQ